MAFLQSSMALLCSPNLLYAAALQVNIEITIRLEI